MCPNTFPDRARYIRSGRLRSCTASIRLIDPNVLHCSVSAGCSKGRPTELFLARLQISSGWT